MRIAGTIHPAVTRRAALGLFGGAGGGVGGRVLRNFSLRSAGPNRHAWGCGRERRRVTTVTAHVWNVTARMRDVTARMRGMTARVWNCDCARAEL